MRMISSGMTVFLSHMMGKCNIYICECQAVLVTAGACNGARKGADYAKDGWIISKVYLFATEESHYWFQICHFC